MKSLEIAPGFSNAMSEDEESIYFWEPGYLPLPAPYYYDLHDWSVIGRMKKLEWLVIKGVYIDDFSFLSACQNLKRLKLYKTNFSDCRLLSGLPGLKEVHLIFCDLEHIEVLQDLPVRCCTEGTIELHPALEVRAVPVFNKQKIIDRDIEALLKSDSCCFKIGEYLLEIIFSADRAAFIKYTDKTNVYCYENGSGNHNPVPLMIGECPEERMMCYDGRAIRKMVYYFCCTGGWNHVYKKMMML
ncbi:MAG: leucine-rich repeat domain-containing protein [Lachnospiraceae bacterium]|nr:leucine-rich repeat domain-containing protein [Lachnospiraceae bacterium]